MARVFQSSFWKERKICFSPSLSFILPFTRSKIPDFPDELRSPPFHQHILSRSLLSPHLPPRPPSIQERKGYGAVLGNENKINRARLNKGKKWKGKEKKKKE